jgi:hypothetical protein
MEKPSVISTASGFVTFPISLFIQATILQSAIRSAIGGTSAAAGWLADKSDVLRKGGLSEIDGLKRKDLVRSDP